MHSQRCSPAAELPTRQQATTGDPQGQTQRRRPTRPCTPSWPHAGLRHSLHRASCCQVTNGGNVTGVRFISPLASAVPTRPGLRVTSCSASGGGITWAALAAASTNNHTFRSRTRRSCRGQTERCRVTDLPGTLADFAAAGTPEPVVLYRSLMTNPASTGSAYSAVWSTSRWAAMCGHLPVGGIA